jgi:hypothetical protein
VLEWATEQPRSGSPTHRRNSWSADGSYNIGKAGHHRGWGGHHSASDHFGHAGDGDNHGDGIDGRGGGEWLQ